MVKVYVKWGEGQPREFHPGNSAELLQLVEKSRHFGTGTLETEGGATLGSGFELVAEATYLYFPARAEARGAGNLRYALTTSALLGVWSSCTTNYTTLVSASTDFKNWFTEPRQARFNAWVEANREELQVPSCGAEPDAICYTRMGQLAKRLLVVAAVLDTAEGAVTTSQVEEHAYFTEHLLVVTDQEIACGAAPAIGKRKPDYAVFCRIEEVELAERQYRHLLQVGELVQAGREAPLLNKFKVKLGQCLDHAGRFELDGGLCLGIEVSDGVYTRCGVAMRCSSTQQLQLQLGSDWLKHPTGVTGSGMQALIDKLVLAYYAYRQLELLLAAAAEPRADESSPTEPPQVAAGSLLEVLEDSGEDGGEDGGNGQGQGRSFHDAQRSSHDQFGGRGRLAVRVLATLGQRELPAGGVVLVLAGRLEGGIKPTPRDVIVRVGSKPSLTHTGIHYQQLAREHLALQALRRAGAPYLPRLVAAGVAAQGGAGGLSGAPVLLTEPRGAPLHRHLAWHRGVTMAPHHVLLAAACLAAAGCTLLAYGVRSNDIRPDNVTVTVTAGAASLQGCMYHLVDLGAASCPALNSPAFRATWGLTGPCDLSALAPVRDLFFGSLEALLGSSCCIDPPPLLPLSDLQSVLFTLVFLAGGSLPWAQAARRQDIGAAVEGRQQALRAAGTWEGLAVLPEPVAGFGAWVLGNAGRDTVTVHEVKLQVDKLFSAVQQDLGVSLPPLELPMVT